MKHFVFELLIERQQVVVYNFTRITHLVVLNLIKIYSFRELVGLTPHDYWYFELTS